VTSSPLALSLDVSAVPTRPGGAGYYTMELARALCARDDIRLTMLSRLDDQDRWRALAGAGRTVVGAVPRSRPSRLVFEQVRLPRLIRSLGVELHHAPHYTMPERAPVPCVVTIHDCIFFDHPEWHLRSKAMFFRRAIRRAARHAAVLVTGSEFTAARLRASCDVRAPIVVAPHGVDLGVSRRTNRPPGRITTSWPSWGSRPIAPWSSSSGHWNRARGWRHW
jgi:glycosyltransferase involved in cell wall biosynthesis